MGSPKSKTPQAVQATTKAGQNTEAAMFPGIDGLCRYIEWFHAFMRDESGLIEN